MIMSSPPSRRSLPPPCWSHDETLALIQSYRHKWHSLRRSNLRASHWDEVASDLSRRTSLLPSSSPKTPLQCRHKIEKLRKRFRSLSLHSPPISTWPFFPFMQSLHFPPIPNNKTETLPLVSPKGDMVAALRRVGEGYVRMEKVKMEMGRERERVRREMELKRTRMILDSQQQLVDAFLQGFGGKLKGRFANE